MYEALSRMTKAQSISLSWRRSCACCRPSAAPSCCCTGCRRRRRRSPDPPLADRALHSKSRDAKAISHHYDVSNQFYEWVLGPSMAYTCACYPREDATLEEAQANKFDLVARKLGLREGMRLLDVGCGWGGMVMHAAREYGVKALGVTLSAQPTSRGTPTRRWPG